MSSKIYVEGCYVPTRVQLRDSEAEMLWRYARAQGWSMEKAVGEWLRSMPENYNKNEGQSDANKPTRTKQQ